MGGKVDRRARLARMAERESKGWTEMHERVEGLGWMEGLDSMDGLTRKDRQERKARRARKERQVVGGMDARDGIE